MGKCFKLRVEYSNGGFASNRSRQVLAARHDDVVGSYMVSRMYGPKQPLIDGTWKDPKLVEVK